MARFEMIFCAITWGLVNALLIAVTFDAAAPATLSPPVLLASTATAPVA